MITGVQKIIVPVDDEMRTREFWTRKLGFNVVRDETYGEERWIEVSPSNQPLVLVLSHRRPDEPRREVPDPSLSPHNEWRNCCPGYARHPGRVLGYV